MSVKSNSSDVMEEFIDKLKAGFDGSKGGVAIYLKKNWIKIGALALSATQTFVLINFFAPPWAPWLPYVAIIILEGGVLNWIWREETADLNDVEAINLNDDSRRTKLRSNDPQPEEKKEAKVVAVKGKKHRQNEQEWIANGMVWISLIMSAITMLAGVFIEITQSKLSEILSPNKALTGLFGWASLTGIFLLVTINLVADWRYKRADPLLKLERENRQEERKANRIIRATKLKGELLITQKESGFLAQRYQRASTRKAWDRAKATFEDGSEPKLTRKKRIRRE